MKAVKTALADVLVIEPAVFGDARGFFYESWNQRAFDAAVGREVRFVQDNHSSSMRGVLRGLHYQVRQPQGKLVRVIAGEVFDVAVDLRQSSPTFGRWWGCTLSAGNRRQLYVPPGFAHGFCVTSDAAEVIYKCTEVYHPEDEQTLLWNAAPGAATYDVAATFHKLGDTGRTVLASGDRIAPGDRLALDFRATRPTWVYVLDADDRGECYLLFPQPLFDRANPVPALAINAAP